MKKTRAFEREVQFYIFNIQKIGLLFHEAMKEYFKENCEGFHDYMCDVKSLESELDKIRKNIEYNLYSDMLIPESRGDVLGILETLDDVANVAQIVLVNFDIEKPQVPKKHQQEFLKMVEMTKRSVEELVHAVTTFFTHSDVTPNYIKKVLFYEHEVDKLEESLKRDIFGDSEISSLAHKMHIRYFIESVASISDCAEDVCHRLTISTIKRSI